MMVFVKYKYKKQITFYNLKDVATVWSILYFFYCLIELIHFLHLKKIKKIRKKITLFILKTIKLFKYDENNKRYWNKAKVYKLVVTKVLPIMEAFYLGYSLLFLFSNIISYFIYANNALRI